jgi:hypothetical protein
MPVSGEERVPSHRGAGATVALAVLLLLALIGLALLGGGGSPAGAATFGQIGEPWGTIGTGAGQIKNPTMFGVDPVDGSVYIGDTPPGEPPPAYRLQKFSSEGTFEAAVELPAYLNVAQKKERLSFRGVAVDHARGLVYVLEQCGVTTVQPPKCKETGTGGTAFALALRVFKTTPSGGEMVPATMPRIVLPTSEEDQIRKPTSIAVDPVSHGIVIFGYSLAGVRLIERIGASGGVEARDEDTSNLLEGAGEGRGRASALAVGPTGTVYAVAGVQNQPGATATRAWELPENFSASTPPTQVPGFKAAAEHEGWGGGMIFEATSGAPEVAVSKDGSHLYWKEVAGGEILVHDFSLTTNSTTAVYGGGESRCQIRSSAAPIGVAGEGTFERLFVLDPGTATESRDKVLTFGSGGSGCPVPLARFTINGTETDGTTVQAGEVVEFDASSSELLEKEEKRVRRLTWNFADGTPPQVVNCPVFAGGTECEEPASLKVTHEYSDNGEFVVTLEIELEHATFGNPVPAQHTLKVEGGTSPPPKEITVQKAGTGTGKVKSSPGGISCGSECSAPFEAGQTVVLTATPDAGSSFVGWSVGGCSGTGTCTLVGGTEQSVTAEFEAEGPPPSEFELSVSTSGSGTVTSSPAGISCGSACAARFAAGATVILMATPDSGATFSGWSGACNGTGACDVEMSETRSVRATFAAVAVGQTLVVSLAGNGAGAVKSEKPGINCGSLCEGTYKSNTVVALFPEAMPGSEFASWGGACVGAVVVCEVKMSAERNVSAVFALKPVLTPTPISTPAPAAVAAPPAEAAPKPKGKKKSSTSKALERKLAKCRKLKGTAKAKCVRRAKAASHKKRAS